MNKDTNPYGEKIVRREGTHQYQVASGVWYLITDQGHLPLTVTRMSRTPDLRVMQRGIDPESLLRMMYRKE